MDACAARRVVARLLQVYLSWFERSSVAMIAPIGAREGSSSDLTVLYDWPHMDRHTGSTLRGTCPAIPNLRVSP